MAETSCGVAHLTILDAISHAEEQLGFPKRWRLHARYLNVGAEYCFGTMNHNDGNVIGRQMGPRIRWRLDYDPKKGAHVNDEDRRFSRKVYHPIADLGFLLVNRNWRKWTSQTSPIDRAIQHAAYTYLRGKRTNPALTIVDVCSRVEDFDTAKLVKGIQEYLVHFDYLPGMF